MVLANVTKFIIQTEEHKASSMAVMNVIEDPNKQEVKQEGKGREQGITMWHTAPGQQMVLATVQEIKILPQCTESPPPAEMSR